jgi:membrane associated rhomboid family serine protease
MAILGLGTLLFIVEWALGMAGWHAAIVLFLNMLCLWVFADNVEDRMGHARFAVFYVLCAIAAAIARASIFPGSAIWAIVTSGGVAGVLGAYLVLYPRGRVLIFFPLPVTLVEVPSATLIAFFAAMHATAGAAAIVEAGAGLMGGALLCFAFRRPFVW